MASAVEKIEPHIALVDSLKKLLFTGELSDCTVCCGDDVYKTHKAILGSQSGFFRKVFTGGFREAIDSIVNLEDDEPAVVKAMLDFMYTCDYSQQPVVDGKDEEKQPSTVAVFNAQVYGIGEKYDISPLKFLALSRFEGIDWSTWVTADFCPLVRTVFDITPSTDKGLRGVVTEAILKHRLAKINENDGLVALLHEIPDFGGHLAEKLLLRPALLVPLRNYNCPRCSRSFSMGLTSYYDNHYCPYCTYYFNLENYLIR